MLLHAITATDAPRLDRAIQGLRGRPLARIDQGALSAWVSCVDELDTPFDPTDLRAVHEIVSALHERLGACLPARFPTWIDNDALRRDLRRRSAELGEALERVRGRAELAVTAVWLTPQQGEAPIEASTPGTRYLLERRQAFAGSDRQRALAQSVAEEIESLVGQDLVDARRTICPSAGVALSTALLVPRARADEIKTALTRAGPDVRILVNGPWPPYTFASFG